MVNYKFAALGLFLSTVIFFVISSIISKSRHARRARQWGCQPAQERKAKLPLGIDLVWDIIKADRDQVVPAFFFDIYKGQGVPTWRQNILGTQQYMTTDPKNIQAILATQFNDFEIGEQRRGNFFPMFGNGIFTTDGKAWEHSRTLLRPQFARQQVSDLNLEEVHVQDMFQHLSTKDGWTNIVDLGTLFFRLTLDSATEFLFGQSVNSQLAALPGYSSEKVKQAGNLDWTSFGRAFDAGTMTVGARGRLAELYWVYSPKHFHENIKLVHQFADYYVNLALTTDLSSLSEHHLEKGQKKEKYIFLKELVQATRDPVELRSQLLNILLAGRDTTAGLLGWTFYHLVRHPDIFKKLRDTIVDQFGTYEEPKEISFETLKGCSYLQHTMSEVLRHNATVPMNSRRATKDTTIPRGGGPDGNSPLYVPKGREVAYSVHVMHNREDIWGPDVAEFKPERWVGRKPGWEFLPFNGGPRICLGQQFALTEAGYVIVRMLQKFDKIENHETDPIMRHQYSVTTAPARVPVRLHEAAASS
ncbi:hypothetical protein LTR99_008827 [Exophiala xenobiotica]|uniref:Cytochrome P450 n=1 Tax=Vermiconidia calcicola TaxID=1690605 RepID=A0AAV9Q4Q1_9PEZI|nr:hypothetical protein LTR96_009096 [Exophiala xenobiotica]KAK5533471.1 hypothetical protein LTR25_007337 [Vermiconidia calcicola]KAK5542932.1 hypothetical protein LTR23_005257 [Chaetothyriales sp. CCFEE 6169]KAK5296460.1 hypothetical protein LTR99_008827 [Exophiala xenobiotica]KAK5334513.1 hypothetical protein LTR98_009467 [Exophiala xenobiotica]